MNLRLDGRVALVSGAAGGIGQACARALAAEGCRVIVTDASAGGINALEHEDPETYYAVVGDLSSADDPADIVTRGVAHFGRLDIVIAAAGVFGRASGAFSQPPTERASYRPTTGIKRLLSTCAERFCCARLRYHTWPPSVGGGSWRSGLSQARWAGSVLVLITRLPRPRSVEWPVRLLSLLDRRASPSTWFIPA